MVSGKTKAKTSGIIGIIFLILALFIPLIFIALEQSIDKSDIPIYLGLSLPLLTAIICVIFAIVFIALSVAVYFIDRSDINKAKSPINNAKKILYERYAKGEISKEEFENMKKDIGD